MKISIRKDTNNGRFHYEEARWFDNKVILSGEMFENGKVWNIKHIYHFYNVKNKLSDKDKEELLKKLLGVDK